MTWNPSDKSSNITLSGGNLVATATTAANGAVRGTQSRSSNKRYFEITPGTTYAGGDTGMGICTAAAILSSVGATVLDAILVYPTGATFYNGSFVTNTTGAIDSTHAVGFAIDLDNFEFWARNGSGIWNGSAAANPTTNVGGISISTVFSASAAFPAQAFGNSGSFCTANFTGPFANTIPSGYAPWEGSLFSDSITESASAADALSATATLSGSVVESVSAADLVGARVFFSGNIVEAANAVDLVRIGSTYSAAILEIVSAFDTTSSVLVPPTPVAPSLTGVISYLLMFTNAGTGQADPVLGKYYQQAKAINIGCCPNILVYDLTTGQIDSRWGIFLTFPAPVIPELYLHPNLELLAVSPVSLAVETFVIINNLDLPVNDYRFMVSGLGQFPIPKVH